MPGNEPAQGFSAALQSWLGTLLEEAGAVAGTVHLHENGGLGLAAAVNIPARLQEVVAWVPSGKGMAGLALERGEPVQTCNLQADRSGAVNPGAKAVNAQAAVAMPVRGLPAWLRSCRMRRLISSRDSGFSDSMRCRVSARCWAWIQPLRCRRVPQGLECPQQAGAVPTELCRHGGERLALADADHRVGKLLCEVGTAGSSPIHGCTQSRVSSATAALAQASSTRPCLRRLQPPGRPWRHC